ncbi:glycoside hydrolase superfamily [Apiospora rasikravindrae]|uniref:chitinase n=1 Tax=Apiospora rasikravindrae TaxID=990691 RepID=A0ABR1U8Y3_9PEZI
MHSFHFRLAAVAAVLASLASSAVGFQKDSRDNVAVYWGQNFVTGGQQRLSTYCASSKFNIIPISFLVSLTNPSINLANGNDNCTTFPGSQLMSCPQVEEDIKSCQSKHGKTIMLSIGGETYQEGGFSSASAARTAAETVWNLFGPNTKTPNRPFGSAVIDGFDFDFESATKNMQYYLSAAPQCPFPDRADGEMLAGEVSFDFIMVQFYNNYCGVQNFIGGGGIGGGGGSARREQSAFNFAAWDAWARGKPLDGSRGSKNPNVKILLGVPASKLAASTGFVEPALLQPIMKFCADSFPSFGGVMMWDMSHLFSSSGGTGSFLEDVHGALSMAASAVTKGIHRINHDNATETEPEQQQPPAPEAGEVQQGAPDSDTADDSNIINNNSSSSSSINSGSTTPTTSASTRHFYSSTVVSWLALATLLHLLF